MAAWRNGLHGANLSAVADETQQAMDLLDEFNSGLLEPDSCEESE